MKNKIYITVPKSNKIVEKDKFDTPQTPKYMIAHFPDMVQELQLKSGGI